MQSGAKRLAAIKTRISEIQVASQVVDPTGPTGLLLPSGVTAYRVHLIGAVVSEPELSEGSSAMAIDDGSGSLVIRAFDSSVRMAGLGIGDIVTVVGRPRPSSDGLFLSPEIVKKTDAGWMKYHLSAIERLGEYWKRNSPAGFQAGGMNTRSTPPGAVVGAGPGMTINVAANGAIAGSPMPKLGVVEEEVVFEENTKETPERKIINLIKKYDKGPGADGASVIAEAKNNEAERIIDKLLKNGDIFAVGPGRYKALD